MNITVNNSDKEVEDGKTLYELLCDDGYCLDKVLASVNDEVLKPDSYKDCVFKDGDSVELMSFAGGG